MRIAQAERRDESRRGRHECLRHGGSAENLVAEADQYPWSSAAAHCVPAAQDPLLDLALWRSVWTPPAWEQFLAETVPEEQTLAIRRSTHTGRPLGSPGFVRQMEITLRRRLTPEKGGRRPKQSLSTAQQAFAFRQD